jgi:hypothetical protein
MTTQQSAQIDCNPTHIRFSLRRWRNRVAVDNEPFTLSQGSRFAANPGLKGHNRVAVRVWLQFNVD